MGVNDKLAATFHPHTFTCDCRAVYTSAIAALFCCDIAAPGPADDDRPVRYHLSEN